MVGAGACLAVLTALTIGPAVLVAVVVALVVLVRRPGGVDAGVTGLISGAGVLVFRRAVRAVAGRPAGEGSLRRLARALGQAQARTLSR